MPATLAVWCNWSVWCAARSIILALVLPNCDRPAARVIGHFVLDEVRRLSGRQPELAQVKLSVSIGVATVAMPAKNFPAQSLIGSAERCMKSAQLSGGNAVKSID